MLDREDHIPLTEDILQHTLFQYCTTDDAIKLDLAFRQLDELKDSNFRKSTIKSLLQHTAKAEVKEAVFIARHAPSLILTKHSFTEDWCGQREWKSISPLEYAAWAGDTALLNEYIKQIPTERIPDALIQLKKIKTSGTEHGQHLSSVLTLISAYETYQKSYDKWDWQQRDDYWIHTIGKYQLHSPVNLLKQVFSQKPLLNFPKLFQSIFSSPRNACSYDLTQTSQLGITFALYKGSHRQAEGRGVNDWVADENDQFDLQAIKTFYQARTQDLNIIIKNLEIQNARGITLAR